VRIDVIHADTYDHGIVLCIFIYVALKIVSFDRATRGEVFGIEVKHNNAPHKITAAE
jgi:hypothetical protein